MLNFLALGLVSVALLVSTQAFGADPVEYMKPVRQVTGRMKISKFSISRNSSGAYGYKITPVCQKNILVDVYDVRTPKPGDTYKYGAVETCDAEILGRKIVVEAVAVVALQKEVIFDGEPAAEVRANTFGIQSRTATGENYYHAGGSVVTRDLTTSAILTAEERPDWKCEANGTCGPANIETLSATVEFGP